MFVGIVALVAVAVQKTIILVVALDGEPAKGLFRRSIQLQYLPGAQQEYRIRTLVVDGRRIKQNRHVVPPGVRQQLIQSGRKPVQLSQIKRAKVQKEIPVDQLVVYVEADDGKLLIGIGCVEEGIANQNLVVLQAFFQSAVIESILMSK